MYVFFSFSPSPFLFLSFSLSLSRSVPGAKHFSNERPSLWVCAFVRGSARSVVLPLPSPRPPSKKKDQKVQRAGRWHEKMGRKGLNCDAVGGRVSATLYEQADWKRKLPLPFPTYPSTLRVQSAPPLPDTLPLFSTVLFLSSSAKLILPAPPR